MEKTAQLQLQVLVDLIVAARGDKQRFVAVSITDDAFCTVEDICQALPKPAPIIRSPEDKSQFPCDSFPTADLFDVRDFYHDRDIDSTVPVLFFDPAASYDNIKAADHLASFARVFKPVQQVEVTAAGFRYSDRAV